MKTYSVLHVSPLAGALAALLLPLLALHGADAPRGATAAPSPSDVITLSPFEVTSDLDQGYRAGGTLAGTRLRSDLRDVAAAVSVVTKDFLTDIAATDLSSLLNYTVGTEVTGVSGNFSGTTAQSSFVDYDTPMGRSSPGTRVRGLSSADLTRDFFLTDIPLDSYITDRIEINRGANSMLFGLGSPAGIINNSLIKAQTRRNETEAQIQFGRFGSHRETLDHNQVIAKDKFAVRLATLYGDRRYQPEFTFSRDKRGFVAATYRPFRGTTIRANTEIARRDENKPWGRPPYDSFTPWWNYGKPVFNPNTNLGTMLGTPSDPTLNGINPSGSMNGNLLGLGLGPLFNSAGLGIIYENPASGVAGITGLPAGTNAVESNNERMFGVANGGFAQIRQAQIFARFSRGGPNHPYSNFWRDFQITDPSIFDFYNHTLDGGNKHEAARWNTHNITLEQTFFRGLAGVELAFDKQNFDSFFNLPLNFRSYALAIDINTHLPNGVPNANYGRPFVADVSNAGSSGNEREARRATAYVDVDLKRHVKGRLGEVLGRHVLTLNYTDQDRSTYSFGGRSTVAGLDFVAAESVTVPNISLSTGGGRRFFNRVVYLGPSVINAASPANLHIEGVKSGALSSPLTSVNALYFQSPPVGAPASPTPAAPFQYRTFSVIQNRGDLITDTTSGANRSRQEFEAGVAVVQSKWLNNSLVTTVGWRRDNYKTYSTSGTILDPTTGIAATNIAQVFPRLDLEDGQNSFNYGVVGHTPEFIRRRLPFGMNLSVTYNKSDNFRPTNQRYDIKDNPIAAETGTTKEYGALVTFFGGKFELRATHYELTASLATNGALRTVMSQLIRIPEEVAESIANGTNDDKPGPTNAWRAWEQTDVAKTFFKTFRYDYQTNPNGTLNIVRDDRASAVVPTSDVVSTGWEYEAVVNPVRNWRIAFNAAKQQAVRSNTGRDVLEFVNAVAPAWTGEAGQLRRITGAGNTDTLAPYFAGIIGLVQKEILLDGSASPELRKWRWNVVTNYSFSNEGRLKGWSVGGAMRWQDKITIGYPIIVDPVTGPRYDVTAPLFGPVESNVDLWLGYGRKLGPRVAWRVQLNVRNVGVGDELIPITTQPDGTIAGYRIAEPMVWTLTNTFKF